MCMKILMVLLLAFVSLVAKAELPPSIARLSLLAEALLRKDLMERCAVFRRFGKDSVLLAALSYNVGVYRLLGGGRLKKSRLVRKLEAGDRDIYREYVSFRMYRGKVLKGLETRRKVEFALLFVP